MSQAPAGPESLPVAVERHLPGLRFGPVGLGVGIFVALVVCHAIFEVSVSGVDHYVGSWEQERRYATATIVELLLGFLMGARAGLIRATRRDLATLRAGLPGPAGEDDTLARELRSLGGIPGVLAPLAAVPVGLLVVPHVSTGSPYLLSGAPWEHGFVWALVVNTLLFALLGRLVFETFAQMRVLGRVEVQLGEIDLLDPEPRRIFARPGLRSASVWFGGSAIASLIFVNVSFHWATGAVILATLGVGTLAFVLPMRGVHRRVGRAKRAELGRVRGAVRAERRLVLERQGSAERLSALLAYEARIERVREWPFDVPTLLRFLILALVAAGSWLGGAVVERLLGVFLD
jgi:hypothetical protein